MLKKRSKYHFSKKSLMAQSKASVYTAAPIEILKLTLSPKTQSYVKCRIGVQILNNNNWVLISKFAALASLEFSDDFRPATSYIVSHDESEMLIGTYGFERDIPEEFQLCTTVEEKNRMLRIIEKRKIRIEQIFDMPVYVWSSYGSEEEVLGMQNLDNRSLFVVEIDSVFPIFVGKRVFSMLKTNKSMYFECFTTRHEYKNVWRKRVDFGCQTRQPRKNTYVQTVTSTSLNNKTMYENQVCVQSPKPEICKRIAQFLDTQLDLLEDLLQLNFYVHLHTIDYQQFSNPYIAHVYTNYKQIVACQDIRKCQGKQVSSVSWNPFISGIFVASYVETSLDHLDLEEPMIDVENIFDEHFALVWSFSDMQKPKLYLHSFREITHVSFCPYDGNIVVGGCSNGQVVIWDITGQLKKAETKEILTPVQEVNRKEILKLTEWMQMLPGAGHVNVTVFSSVQHSQKTAITNITWVPPEYYITTTGQYIKCQDDNMHMQFLTSGLEDDNICVWDLKHYQNVRRDIKRKPLQRLSKVPVGLNKDDSPLKKKHALFIPVFKLFIRNPANNKPLHVRSFLLRNQTYSYEKRRTVKIEHGCERIFFEFDPVERIFDWEQSFVVNTVSGMLYDCSWKGFSYDHGTLINFDSCCLDSYVSIHDAPIKMCIANKDDPNIFLSIGGKVFAIWHRTQSTPIIWRKSIHSHYIFGTWSYVNSFEILLFTNYGFIQLWNFHVNTKFPIYKIRLHGLPPVGVYSNAGIDHYLSNAIILLDCFGAIRVHTAGSMSRKTATLNETRENIRNFLDSRKNAQNCVAYWRNRFKKTHIPEEVVATEDNQPIDMFDDDNEEIKIETTSRKIQFEKKKHDYMYEQLTKMKSIKLEQLEANKSILREMVIQNNELGRKCNEFLSNKDLLFEKKKRLLIWQSSKLGKDIYKITLSKECAKEMKKKYYEQYLLIEEELSLLNLEDFHLSRPNMYKTKRRIKTTRGLTAQVVDFNFRKTVQFGFLDFFDR